MSFIPDTDDLLKWAKGLKFEPVDEIDVSDLLERMRVGTMGQESGGSQDPQRVRNPRTSATGMFQVLPANIPPWTQKHFGRSLTPVEFANNPQAQEAVFTGEMGKYLKSAMRQAKGDEDLATRMAAAAWYGGEGAMSRYDDPVRFRPNEPSFREYTSSVLDRTNKALNADAVWNKVDGLLNNIDETSVWADVDKLLKPKPLPETQPTLDAQIQSAMDMGQMERSGVLTTTPEQNGQFANRTDFIPAQVGPDKMFWLYAPKGKKLKLKTSKGLQMFLDGNKDALVRLMGKKFNAGDDTAEGIALRTEQGGRELSTSIVTPETIESQAASDLTQFPQADNQVALTAQDAVKSRMLDHMLEGPDFLEPEMQEILNKGPIEHPPLKRLTAPPPALKQGVVTKSLQKGTPSGSVDVSVDSLTPTEIPLDDSRVVNAPKTWNAGEKDQTDEEVLQGHESYLINLEGVKDKKDTALRQVFSRLQKDYGISADKLPDFLAATGRSEGAFEDQDKEVTIDIPRSYIQTLGGDPVKRFREEQRDKILDLYTPQRDALLKQQGEHPSQNSPIEGSTDPLRNQAIQNVKNSMFGIQGGDFNADVESEVERLKKWGLTPEERAEVLTPERRARAKDAGLLSSLLAGISGGTGRGAQALAGVSRFVGVPGMVPEEWSIALSKEGQKMQVMAEGEAEDQPEILNKGIRIVGGLAGDLPRFALLSRLPGGTIGMFATDYGLQALGKGERPETVAKEVAKGAITGAIFRGASKLSRAVEAGTLNKILGGAEIGDRSLLATRDAQKLVGKVFGIGAKLGSIAGGTATQTKVETGSTKAAFESGLTNALLALALEHHGDISKGIQGLKGKIFRVKSGETVKDVTIDEKGDIHEVKTEVPKEAIDVNIALEKPQTQTSAPKESTATVSELRKETPVAKEVKAERPVESGSELQTFSQNKIFTADKVAEAREVLKKKNLQFNSGIDPESFKALATIGAAHIESGARKFADFSKAMVDDLGEKIKPHLESLYRSIRDEQKFEGMEKGNSKVGKSIEAKAVEAGLQPLKETAEYEKVSIKDQAEKAAQMLSDMDKVNGILDGTEPLPEGLRGASAIKAIEDHALRTKDAKLLQKLAKSDLISETSQHAQEMRLLRERDPDSATAKLQELKKAREEATQKRLGKKSLKDAQNQEVSNIKENIKKTSSKRPSWGEFIQSITCGY